MRRQYYYRTRMHLLLTEELLNRVKGKFHYEDKHLQVLEKVAKDVYSCIKDQETMELICDLEKMGEGEPVDVAMTLGGNLDILLNKYSTGKQVMEQLMAENIVSELMLEGYQIAVEKACMLTKMNIKDIHFWGEGADYPFGGMEKILEELSTIRLNLTKNGNLKPAKSVVFQFRMTEATEEFKLNLCGDCEFGKSGRCTYGKK